MLSQRSHTRCLIKIKHASTALVFLVACQTAPAPTHPATNVRVDPNPNGSSELAWLMRDMYDQGVRWRAALAQNESLGAYPAFFNKLPTATPTTLTSKDEHFEPLSKQFLERTQALIAARDPAEQRQAYDAWVSGCLACHATMCSGPVPKIKGLRLPEP